MSKEIERRANGNYICNNCACTIYKGHKYKDELIYEPVIYNTEYETSSGGCSVHWRQHLSSNECDLATRLEIGRFL